jgi:hypothetical protein
MGFELRALVVGSGFEPLKAKPADLQSAPIGHSGNPPKFCARSERLQQEYIDWKSAKTETVFG